MWYWMNRENQPVVTNSLNIFAHLITSHAGSLAENPDSSSLRPPGLPRRESQEAAPGTWIPASRFSSPCSFPALGLLPFDLLGLSFTFCLTHSWTLILLNTQLLVFCSSTDKGRSTYFSPFLGSHETGQR